MSNVRGYILLPISWAVQWLQWRTLACGASSGYTDDWAAAWALDAAHCDDTTDNTNSAVFASSPEILFIDSPEDINL